MSSLPPTDEPGSAPLPYAMPHQQPQRRPGLMTAVAIASIVVGAISALLSLSGVASGLIYMMISAPPGVPAPLAVPPPTTIPSGSAAVATTSNVTASGTMMTVSTGPATMAMPFRFHVDPRASMLSIVENSLSLLLATLLIIAGILLLRDSKTSLRLHRIYVILKLPLIPVAAFATWWTVSTMMNGMFGAGISGAPTPGFGSALAVTQALFHAVFASLYPIALIIVLSSKTSKAYFKSISGAAEAGQERPGQ